MIKKRIARDFKFIRILGEGSFSSVYLAVDADIPLAVSNEPSCTNTSEHHQSAGRTKEESQTGCESHDTSNVPVETKTLNNTTVKKIRKYAIKVCQKSHIKRQNKQMAIMREKEIMNILNQCQCKHFIRLYCTFQDMERLFFVMSYAKNGELLTYMLKHPLSTNTVRKFTLQLVSALEHLHKLNIVHRDLKPENILLNELLELLISDFGSAQIYNDATTSHQLSPPQSQTELSADLGTKTADTTESTTPSINPIKYNNNAQKISTTSDRRNSFVGTAQYVSPEMLRNREASHRSDLWALGVIVYQMMTNIMPFDAPNEYLIYKKIQSLDYGYPDNFDESARNLVESLIKLDPKERLGANDNLHLDGYQSIRRHCFLFDTDSEQLMTAPDITDGDASWRDIVQSDPDLRNIDKIAPGLDETQMLRLLTDG